MAEKLTGVRINKYISSAGLCSRREADTLIEKGLVLINGKKAENGDKVNPGDVVTVDGKKIVKDEETVVFAYYKPKGIVCSKNGQGAKTVYESIDYRGHLAYVGRLDKDSEGLLLLTNDGDLADRISRARYAHEKEYLVRVDRLITDSFLKRMAEGIKLSEGVTRPCKVEKLEEKLFRIILTQGLNRQIRRMCETCGYRVRRLKRIRVMNITLDGLKVGEYRELSKDEVEALKDASKKVNVDC